MEKFDFGGWATKNDLQCTDGRIIRKDAFKHCDGKKVPLVWNHGHGEVTNVIGHAILKNRDEGVYSYCSFNDTSNGKHAREVVLHGDIESLSIYASRLKQSGANVLHGEIIEVSLVQAGANPGASIEEILLHGEISEDAGIIYSGELISLSHSNKEDEEVEETEEDEVEEIEEETVEETEEVEVEETDNPDDSETKEVASEDKTETNSEETIAHADGEEIVADILDSMTDKQKNVVYAILGQTLNDEEVDEDEGGNTTMKHNAFEKKESNTQNNYLAHADQEAILDLAKKNQVGSFQTAVQLYAEDNDLNLQHADAVSGGFTQTGEGNVTMLFPEYAEVRPGAPELITNDQGWISAVMAKVHKSPISRIRTTQVDIRKIDTLRAKGYVKGKQKSQVGNFSLVRRTTDPQTIYVKNALHRDDIIDITDFDYVQYLYNIDKMNLQEELATAMMLGDGREDGDPDKIQPEHIRPIWTDDDLFTIKKEIDLAAATSELQGTGTGVSFGPNYIMAEALINTMLYAREDYRGTGTPDFYCTPHTLNVMLLARDMNGRRVYSSKAELASALNVGDIKTAEQFEGQIRTAADGSKKKLLGLVVNLADYSLGATKGGELTHFNQFDIDFNQMKSLLETRTSGALTRVYSAIAIEEPVVTTEPATRMAKPVAKA